MDGSNIERILGTPVHSIAPKRPGNAILLLAVALAAALFPSLSGAISLRRRRNPRKARPSKRPPRQSIRSPKSAADKPESQTGRASWYALDFQTANGEQMIK